MGKNSACALDVADADFEIDFAVETLGFATLSTKFLSSFHARPKAS